MAFNLFPQTDFRQMDLNYVLDVSKQAAANLEEYAADKEQVVATQAAAEEALATARQDIETARQAATSASQDAQTASSAAGTATQKAESAEHDAQTASSAARTAQEVAESIPADYTQLSNDVDALKSDLNFNKQATPGYVLRATNTGRGTDWAMVGTPTDEQAETAITAWLDEHPEATTTVLDHSLTYNKLVNGTLGYVTPEMFGAKGDGVTDDTTAIQSAIDASLPILFTNSYLINGKIASSINGLILFGKGELILNTTNADQEFTIDVSGSHILIDGLTFTIPEYSTLNNNTSANGITIHNCTDVRLFGCKFVANRTRCNGLLDFYDKWKNVQVINCTFDIDTYYDNSYHPGGIWFRSFYGENCENLTVSNCLFKSKSSDEAVAIWSSSAHVIHNVLFENNIVIGSNMEHLLTIGSIDTVNINGCVFRGTPSVTYLKLNYANNGNLNESISACNFVMEAASYIARSVSGLRIPLKNCTVAGAGFRGSETDFFECTIYATDNQTSLSGCTFYNCHINITQTSAQMFSYDVKIIGCELVVAGSCIQTLSDTAQVYVANCRITLLSGQFFVGRRGTKYIIKNNVFLGSLMPSFGSFLTTDVVMNNLFETSVNYPTNRPVGASNEADTNLVG